MRCWRKKKTQKFIAGLFFSVLIFQGAVVSVQSVHAQPVQGTQSQVRAVDNAIQANTTAAGTAAANPGPDKKEDGEGTFGWIKNAFTSTIIWLLLQLRNFIFLIIASPAASAFAWSIDPANVSGPNGIFNMPAIYTLWQFIRDFFNLFFILILLFSAFATIFQVDSFNIRNIFKNVILVALLINFSFPITRFLIDATNVPMYYFINDVIGNGTGRGGQIAMNNLLGASGISAGTMANTGQNNDIVPVLMSIVFAFLFGVSLAVLAVMMIIRLIALTLLLIFSPLGFAGALLPGLSRYGQEWWSKFWSYALFGPAAALMLVVSLKFLEASGGLYASMKVVAGNNSPDPLGATTMASVIFFTFPIILIWTTIGMANKFSIAGAATVVSMGQWAPRKIQEYGKRAVVGTAKFAGRTTLKTAGGAARVVLPVDRLRGELAGVKESFKDGGKVFGRQIPKFMTAKGRTEAAENKFAAGKGRVQREGGFSTAKAGADAELKKLEGERVRKAVKENKEKGVTAEKHIDTLKDDKASGFDKRVAALSLAQDGEIRTATQLADALAAVKGSADEFNQVLDKAKSTAVGSMDSNTNAKIISLLNETKKDKDGKDVSVHGTRQADLQQAYSGALKKENKAEYRVEAEIAQRSSSGPVDVPQVYRDTLKMGSKDLSKQSGLIQSAQVGGKDPMARAYFEEMAKDKKAFEKVLGSDELKLEDRKVLLEIQTSVGSQTEQTTASQNPQWSEARRNAEAAFDQPSNSTGQNGNGPQNP